MMESTTLKLATMFQPQQGKTLEFLGNIATCKFNPDIRLCQYREGRHWQFYELLTKPGNPVPLHSHPWDEMSYLLEGEVDLQVEDQRVLATPGYFINLPKGATHAFTTISPQAKFLVGVSNPIAVQFMVTMAQAQQAQELTPERVMAIAQQHHVRVAAN